MTYSKQELEDFLNLLEYLDKEFSVDQEKKTFKTIDITPKQAELYKQTVRKRYGQNAYTKEDTPLQYRGLECLKIVG